MKHSNVTKVMEIQQVRDDLLKLQQEITRTANDLADKWQKENGTDDFIPDVADWQELPVKHEDLVYWSAELRRLLSFFC